MKKRFLFPVTAFLLSVSLLVSSPSSSLLVFADDTTEESETTESTEETTTVEEPAEPTVSPAEAERARAEAEAEARRQTLQQEMNAINSQLKELEKEQEAIKSNINSVKSEVAEKQSVVIYLDGQISNTQAEISLLESKIYLLEESITETEEHIEQKQEEYEANYSLFLERVRSMYMFDSSTTLGLVLGTDDFVDFLTTTEMISRIADHDQQLMDELLAEQEALAEEKESLEAGKAELETSRAVTQEKRQELATQQNVAVAQVQSVSSLQQQYEADLANSQAKAKAMESEISRIYEQIQMSQESYVGGEMAWPVPNYSLITSRYGWRFGGTDFHTGVDISGGGVYGKPVIAANDGVVKVANWSYRPGGGYGIFIIIDHGGNISTLYGHLSNITVSVGQEVKRGETIGAVGSTGWSTGPHLHFEVRVNGKHQNPEPYILG